MKKLILYLLVLSNVSTQGMKDEGANHDEMAKNFEANVVKLFKQKLAEKESLKKAIQEYKLFLEQTLNTEKETLSSLQKKNLEQKIKGLEKNLDELEFSSMRIEEIKNREAKLKEQEEEITLKQNFFVEQPAHLLSSKQKNKAVKELASDIYRAEYLNRNPQLQKALLKGARFQRQIMRALEPSYNEIFARQLVGNAGATAGAVIAETVLALVGLKTSERIAHESMARLQKAETLQKIATTNEVLLHNAYADKQKFAIQEGLRNRGKALEACGVLITDIANKGTSQDSDRYLVRE